MTTNLIHFGSPDFSAELLDYLITHPISNVRVVAVVTNPDKPTGRSGNLTPSPVAKVAQHHRLPIFKPRQLDSANLSHLKLLNPHLFLIVAFGKIIPPNWISTPSIASLNIHFSLLPKYRGALCVSEPIKNQDEHTGVTLMEIDEQLDHGPIIAQLKQKISPNDNTATLTKKLTRKATELLEENLPRYLGGEILPQPQNHSQASYTPATSTNNRQNAFIPWEKLKAAMDGNESRKIHALTRSFNPDPGSWTTIDNINIKIISTSVEEGKLHINKLQIAGKNPISWKQFLSGHKPK